MTPWVDAVVLAAGRSRRMAPWNKLLLTGADGRALVAHTVQKVRHGRVRRLVVVIGHQAEAVRAALEGMEVEFVRCDDAAAGLAHSLRAGLAALTGQAAAVLVCLGDMPAVQTRTLDVLIGSWRPGAIVAPAHDGRRGNPVLWDAGFVPQLRRLAGDAGARGLLAELAGSLSTPAVADAGVLLDADTPEAVRALPGGPWRAPDGTLI